MHHFLVKASPEPAAVREDLLRGKIRVQITPQNQRQMKDFDGGNASPDRYGGVGAVDAVDIVVQPDICWNAEAHDRWRVVVHLRHPGSTSSLSEKRVFRENREVTGKRPSNHKQARTACVLTSRTGWCARLHSHAICHNARINPKQQYIACALKGTAVSYCDFHCFSFSIDFITEPVQARLGVESVVQVCALHPRAVAAVALYRRGAGQRAAGP